MAGTRVQREQEEQSMLVDWFYLNYPKEVLIVSANGGKRHIGVARKLKRSGVRPGVPDIFLPRANETAAGLWIEFKPRKREGEPKAKVSAEQKIMLQHLSSRGYLATVCWGFEEASRCIQNYMRME